MSDRDHFDIDAPCGRHFKYRDLIECGKTWRRLSAKGVTIENVPNSPHTIAALRQLCLEILDPVVDSFGPIELTYGFCSIALSTKICSDVAPSLDQHASHETRRTGKHVCQRLGAAVDFKVPNRSSAEVGSWIVQQTRFDRLYYYGPRRPLHVSCGPQDSRAIVIMKRGQDGRRIPRVVRRDAFIELCTSARA
jgi:hypothetical protein